MVCNGVAALFTAIYVLMSAQTDAQSFAIPVFRKTVSGGRSEVPPLLTSILDAGVSVRLVNSSVASEGRLEVRYIGVWGTVCDDSFDNNDASVACYMLGFGRNGTMRNNTYGQGTGQIWLDEVSCVGSETSIAACAHKVWGTNDCTHSEDVSISCNAAAVMTDKQIPPSSIIGCYTDREASRDLPSEFIVSDTMTLEICKKHCLNKGYEYAGAQYRTECYCGHSFGRYGVSVACNLNCAGDSSETCGGHWSNTVMSVLSVRLAGSSVAREGRLEVLHNGVWGTVCDDSFDNKDASVACYMLGFGRNGTMINNTYGQGTGQIWLDDVGCLGSETSIAACAHNAWGTNDCTHNEDVSIFCNAAVSVRLINSSVAREGRLEVLHNGVWGTVCDDSFDNNDASVACYMLGFGRNGTMRNNTYGQGTGQIWLDDVGCLGSETSIAACAHNVWGTNDCTHNEDVSISCNAAVFVSESIIGCYTDRANFRDLPDQFIVGNSMTLGVCRNRCLERGYEYAGAQNGTECYCGHNFGRYGDYTACNINCVGNSSQKCGGNLANTVMSTSFVSVRLAGSSVAREGRLEVLYNGVWGTVCDDHFDNKDASVACYMLGFGRNGTLRKNTYGQGTGQIWLDDVSCLGSETSIAACAHNASGSHDCTHNEDVAISCNDAVFVSESIIGCYTDRANFRDLPDQFIVGNSMTLGVCMNRCLERGYEYAGAQNGTECYCGHNFGRYGVSTACNINCAGNSSQKCGGRLANTVMSTSYVSVRLAGSTVAREGRLEVLYNGVWGTVCDDHFDNKDASVACYMLGFARNGTMRNNTYGQGTGQIWLDDVTCVGSETSIVACAHNVWGTHDCTHSEDVAISCNDAVFVSASIIGCYKDTRDVRDLPDHYIVSKSMTLGVCRNRCLVKGYEYAGAQYGTECFCGHNFGRYGVSTACNFNCAGNSSQTCGGFWANTVMSTSYVSVRLAGSSVAREGRLGVPLSGELTMACRKKTKLTKYSQAFEDSLQLGDLIEIYRTPLGVHLYSHWAVYYKNGYIAHFHAETANAVGLPVGVHWLIRAKEYFVGVVNKDLLRDVAGSDAMRVDNKCEVTVKRRPAQQIANFIDIIANKTWFYYSLAFFNCEHFATYLKFDGWCNSRQIEKLRAGFTVGFSEIPFPFWSWKSAEEWLDEAAFKQWEENMSANAKSREAKMKKETDKWWGWPVRRM